jgi:hypothetical protein
VIPIIAILAVVGVLTLNPAQLLALSRDAIRVSDIHDTPRHFSPQFEGELGTNG